MRCIDIQSPPSVVQRQCNSHSVCMVAFEHMLHPQLAQMCLVLLDGLLK